MITASDIFSSPTSPSATLLEKPVTPTGSIIEEGRNPKESLGNVRKTSDPETTTNNVVSDVITSIGRPCTLRESALSSLLPLTSDTIVNRINAYVVPIIHPTWKAKTPEFRAFTNEALEKVEYILIDLESDPNSGKMLFSLLQTRTDFRTVVSANKIMLLQKQYEGPTEVLQPYNTVFTHQNINIYSGELTQDPDAIADNVIHFAETTLINWHSHRSLLPPGNYNLTMRLKIQTEILDNDAALIVEVVSANGNNILATETIHKQDFEDNSQWQYQTFKFTSSTALVDFEIRSRAISSSVDFYLDYMEVVQIE